MADTERNVFQKIAAALRDFEEWVEETFGDPEQCAAIKDDLGLDPANPATPAPSDPARRARLDAFAARQDVDEQALAEVVTDVAQTANGILAFVDAVKAEAVDPWTLFWALFKLFALETLRVRNPSAYALVRLGGMATQDEETLPLLDAAALTALLRGEEADGRPTVAGEALVQRLSMLGGLSVVLAANLWDTLDGALDAVYGWDPDPGDEGEAAVVAGRALTVILSHEALGGVRPAVTVIPVPAGHGGPGLLVSASAALQVPMDVGDTTYTTEVAGAGRFGAFVPLAAEAAELRVLAGFEPTVGISAEPRAGAPPDSPALVLGTDDGTRLEIGTLAYATEIGDDRAAFRLALRKGKLVLALGSSDALLRQLSGGNVEVPFEIAVVADTEHGFRFEGGTGAKVSLPVSGSLLGVLTVQFLELELRFEPKLALDLRASFSVQLGPFMASVDRVGVTAEPDRLGRGFDGLGELLELTPPRGIGLALDAGPVKGGGSLFIDEPGGGYVGSLELKLGKFSVKAIAVASTRRPDGREGWSLLLFLYGQFRWHIAFGIFWTGLGGAIGLHHRSDVDALTAGMRTGALDDVLFPDDPVADAPRIVNRYRTLFPAETDNLLVGPMLELQFSTPAVVHVRLGLLFDVRNALSDDDLPTQTKVVLVGQVLVQLPPKETKAPALLKLLIDVVGFYEPDNEFLLIRARLRDSFVGFEGFGKIALAGELLLAVKFGEGSNMVLSAGGFHPRYSGLPERIPRDLDRLRAGFRIAAIKFSVEQYFAVVPNSVQAGWKASLKADLGVAAIEASLAWDALLNLAPRFYFVVDIEFKAKVKAFGKTLAAVGVTATLEGPDRWRVNGKLSFSILWWDKTVSFDEAWGTISSAASGVASVGEILRAELENPDNLAPEGPPDGSAAVTLAPRAGERVAHPLGRLAIRQGAVPLGPLIDRVGTAELAGGPTRVVIDAVELNDTPLPGFEPATELFARGQFMQLSPRERLVGDVLETLPAGAVVGGGGHAAPSALTREVRASFETVRLGAAPKRPVTKWSTTLLERAAPSFEQAVSAARQGAAARSERARRQLGAGSPLAAAKLEVRRPPLALVNERSLATAGSLAGPAQRSPTLAAQEASAPGQRVVEAFEVVA